MLKRRIVFMIPQNTNRGDCENTSLSKKYYNSIDGVRALSCLGIILMHIQANTNYTLQGNFIYDNFIPSLTWLVYLFIMISGFGICTGYLPKFQNGTVDLEVFYKKRIIGKSKGLMNTKNSTWQMLVSSVCRHWDWL